MKIDKWTAKDCPIDYNVGEQIPTVIKINQHDMQYYDIFELSNLYTTLTIPYWLSLQREPPSTFIFNLTRNF